MGALKRILFWLLLVRSADPSAENSVNNHVQPGPENVGMPDKTTIIQGLLGLSTAVIVARLLFRLGVRSIHAYISQIFFFQILPTRHQDKLFLMCDKIQKYTKESIAIIESISAWEQKSSQVNGCWNNLKLRAMISNIRTLQERKQRLLTYTDALRSEKADMEAEVKAISKMLNEEGQNEWLEYRKGVYDLNNAKKAVEGYQRWREQPKQKMQRQLMAMEENLRLAAGEVESYKQKMEEMARGQEEAASFFREQISHLQKQADESKAQIHALERDIVDRSWDAALLKHRLDKIKGRRVTKRCRKHAPSPGRPGIECSLRTGACGFPEDYPSMRTTQKNAKKKINMAVERAPPVPKWPYTPYSTQGRPPPSMEYGLLPPPCQWPPGPQPACPPPAYGPHHVPTMDWRSWPMKDKVLEDDLAFPRWPQMTYSIQGCPASYMAWGPQPPPRHWPLGPHYMPPAPAYAKDGRDGKRAGGRSILLQKPDWTK